VVLSPSRQLVEGNLESMLERWQVLEFYEGLLAQVQKEFCESTLSRLRDDLCLCEEALAKRKRDLPKIEASFQKSHEALDREIVSKKEFGSLVRTELDAIDKQIRILEGESKQRIEEENGWRSHKDVYCD